MRARILVGEQQSIAVFSVLQCTPRYPIYTLLFSARPNRPPLLSVLFSFLLFSLSLSLSLLQRKSVKMPWNTIQLLPNSSINSNSNSNSASAFTSAAPSPFFGAEPPTASVCERSHSWNHSGCAWGSRALVGCFGSLTEPPNYPPTYGRRQSTSVFEKVAARVTFSSMLTCAQY